MSTRCYFPETEAAAVSPTIEGADWEHINTLRRRLLFTTPDGSTLTTTAYTPDAADHLVNGDAHHRQYVSDPLSAQNISGTVKAQFQCLEANAGNNLFLTLKIFVVSQDGTTIKETLLAITRDTTNELATALTNRNFPSTAISAADLEAGDRIVVEVGLGGTPTAAGGTQGHNGSLRWGCNASGGDLAENDTETGTTFRGWLEFSDDIVVPTVVEADGAAAGSATPASVAAAIWAGVTAAAGVAASAVAGATLVLAVLSAAGVATADAEGADGAAGGTIVEADGAAAGAAMADAPGAAVWAGVSASAASGAASASGVPVVPATAAAAGVATSATMAAALTEANGIAAGGASALGVGGATATVAAVAAGTGTGLGVSAAILAALGAAEGVSDVVALCAAQWVVTITAAGVATVQAVGEDAALGLGPVLPATVQRPDDRRTVESALPAYGTTAGVPARTVSLP
jgi:hypothetical protein